MKKCDLCVNQRPNGDCKYCSPSTEDCKQATERFFQLTMAREKNRNRNHQTYTKNINIKNNNNKKKKK